MIDMVRELAEALPDRARQVAAELGERHGDLRASKMILPSLRKRARRILQLLRQ